MLNVPIAVEFKAKVVLATLKGADPSQLTTKPGTHQTKSSWRTRHDRWAANVGFRPRPLLQLPTTQIFSRPSRSPLNRRFGQCLPAYLGGARGATNPVLALRRADSLRGLGVGRFTPKVYPFVIGCFLIAMSLLISHP
jgi:hypothetical protein